MSKQKTKKIELIKKAISLGIIEEHIHPFDKERKVILQDNEDKTDEWEELEKYVNSKRNIKLSIGINKEKREKRIKDFKHRQKQKEVIEDLKSRGVLK